MAMFKVTWEMDLDAENAREAAQLALAVHRDPSSIATCFEVEDDTGNIEHIDLTEGVPEDGIY